MNNREKVWRQFGLNAVITVCSVVIIYIGLLVQYGWGINWADGLNAELIFVMITSLGAVVGWRIVEGIKLHGVYNLMLIVALFFSGIGYAMALIYRDSEVLKMCILYLGVIPFFFIYLIEQSALLRNAKQIDLRKKSDSLKYREKK